jgi:hypothetical protein
MEKSRGKGAEETGMEGELQEIGWKKSEIKRKRGGDMTE